MCLQRLLNIIRGIYFLLGQAPPPKAVGLKYHPYIRILRRCSPTLIVLSATIWANSQFFISFHLPRITHVWIDGIIGVLLLIASDSILLISIILPYFKYKKWLQLNQLLIEIELDLKYRLNLSFNQKTFVRGYSVEVLSILITCILGALQKLILPRPLDRPKSEVAYFFYNIQRSIMISHALFYVRLLTALTRPFQKLAIRCGTAYNVELIRHKSLLYILSECKKWHLKSCSVIKLINDIFGWMFVVCLIHLLVSFINTIYYACYYVLIHEPIYSASMYIFIRKIILFQVLTFSLRRLNLLLYNLLHD